LRISFQELAALSLSGVSGGGEIATCGSPELTGFLPLFSQILRAEKEALSPNGFEIDPSGDWGGNQPPVEDTRALPCP
jgi:hypothetical protein